MTLTSWKHIVWLITYTFILFYNVYKKGWAEKLKVVKPSWELNAWKTFLNKSEIKNATYSF